MGAGGGADGGKHVNGKIKKSPTSKIYTPWAHILSERTVFCTAREGGKTAGSNVPRAFLVFFGGHLPQTSGFRSAKQIRGANF